MVVKVIEQFNTTYVMLDKVRHITGLDPPLKLLTKPPRIPIRLSALMGSMIRDVSLKKVSNCTAQNSSVSIQVFKPYQTWIGRWNPKKNQQVLCFAGYNLFSESCENLVVCIRRDYHVFLP